MTRLQYIVKRLLLTVFSIFVIATLVFLIFRLAPGNPASAVVDPSMPPGAREEILDRFGLNEPLHVQYVLYLKNLLSGDLGTSFRYQEPVAALIFGRAVNTMVLMLTSVLIAFLVGPVLGAYFAWNRGTWVDTAGIGSVLVMYAAPVFWTGMLGIMVFSFWLGWVPSGGLRSPGRVTESLWELYLSEDFLRHLVLPLVVTTLYWLTAPTFIMRNNMIDVLGEDFIEMNRAQGLPEHRIIYGHAARNSLLPVVHYGALAVGFAFGASVIIETVFSWPGVGRLMWQAVLTSDYPVAQAAFLFFAVVIILMNFLIDVLTVYIDPRVSEHEV